MSHEQPVYFLITIFMNGDHRWTYSYLLMHGYNGGDSGPHDNKDGKSVLSAIGKGIYTTALVNGNARWS